MKKLFLLATPLLAFAMVGCASMSSLPQSASEVSFELGEEGRTGWSEYKDSVFLKGVDARTAYMAAKSGMADAGFNIKRASFESLTVIGEHGITLYDWNIVAGAYVKSTAEGSWVKVITEGSKDIGINGDQTAKAWPQEVIKGIREYIKTESLITDPNKKHFE